MVWFPSGGRFGGRHSLIGAMVRQLLLLMCLSGVASAGQSQGLSQIACRIFVERADGAVNALAIVGVSEPTRVDYTLRTTKISASGTGASEQSGTTEQLDAGESRVVSEIRMGVEDDGWIEFELRATERLTGNSCEAKETSSAL